RMHTLHQRRRSEMAADWYERLSGTKPHLVRRSANRIYRRGRLRSVSDGHVRDRRWRKALEAFAWKNLAWLAGGRLFKQIGRSVGWRVGPLGSVSERYLGRRAGGCSCRPFSERHSPHG